MRVQFFNEAAIVSCIYYYLMEVFSSDVIFISMFANSFNFSTTDGENTQ